MLNQVRLADVPRLSAEEAKELMDRGTALSPASGVKARGWDPDPSELSRFWISRAAVKRSQESSSKAQSPPTSRGRPSVTQADRRGGT